MFKTHIIFSTLLMFSFFSKAQIEVTNSDMPVLNDTVRFSNSASNVASLISQTGVNQNWDASNLVANFQDIARFRSALNINFLYAGSFSSSSYGTQGQSALSFGGLVQATDAYSFYKNSSSFYIGDGRGFSVQGLPLSQTWKDTIYRFPLNYGDVDSSSYKSSEVNAVIATIRSTGKRVNIVDGWGTITTPYGVFDCIRIKSTIRTTDTLKTSLIPISIPITQNVIEYKWIAKNQKTPMLEISVVQGAGAQTTVKYRDIARPEAFANLARFTINKKTFQVNTASDSCKLNDNSTRNPISRTWTITPNTFQYMGGTNANSQQPRVFFTAPGVYTVSLRVNYAAGFDDTTSVDLVTVADGPKAGFTSNSVQTNTSSIIEFTDTSTGDVFQWLWSIDPPTASFVGGTSFSSQNPKIIFDNAGEYSVSLTVQNNIGSDMVTKQNYISCFTTSIAKLSSPLKASVYPNPANEEFTIQTKYNIAAVTVLDIMGKTVIQTHTNQIATNNLSNGTYFINIQFEDGYTQIVKLSVLH